MQESLKLQKVTFIIREKYADDIEKVQKELWEAGTSTEAVWSDHISFTDMEELVKINTPPAFPKTGKLDKSDEEITAQGKFDWKTSQLVVCDEESIARQLQQAGYAVLIFCNPENKHQNFSGFLYAFEGFEELEADYFIKVWQRYRGLPWQIGETRRCIIREMCEADLEALYQLYQDPALTRYTENLYADKDQELSYIKDYVKKIYSYYGFGTWLMIEKESGSLIGRAGFNYRPGYEEPELGFLIGTAWQNRGYAYEVCTWLLQLAKQVYEWERVQALAHPNNEASIALLLKLGFCRQEEITVEEQRLVRFLYTID